MPPTLRPLETLAGTEVVHWFEAATGDRLTSRGNSFTLQLGSRRCGFEVPLALPRRMAASLRLGRRAMRLDKSNAVLTGDRTAVVVAYQGGLWRFDLATGALERTGTLRQCRNALHQGVLALDESTVLLGEYGTNPERASVPVWRSRDAGRRWEIAYEFPAGSIKHVHGVYHDPFTGKLWLPTGDFAGECYLMVTDPEFQKIEMLGDGGQQWRAVNLHFREDKVCWIMDSQLETSYLLSLDRRTGALACGRDFPGPSWYSKELDDGIVLAQTTCELGDGVKDRFAHLFASRDLKEWVEVGRWAKDRLPMHLFKYGILGFADGRQTSRRFAMFGEALTGFDGKAGLFSLDLDG